MSYTAELFQSLSLGSRVSRAGGGALDPAPPPAVAPGGSASAVSVELREALAVTQFQREQIAQWRARTDAVEEQLAQVRPGMHAVSVARSTVAPRV